MVAKWKTGFNPDLPIKTLEENRTVTQEGRVSYDLAAIEMLDYVIEWAIAFPRHIDAYEKSHITRSALLNIKEKLTKDSLIESINQQIIKETKRKNRAYHFLTSISVYKSCLPNTAKVSSCKLHFYEQYPQKFADRQRVIDQQHVEVGATPNSYAKVVVTLTAKRSGAAVHEAQNAVDLWRGIWCMYANPSYNIQVSGLKYEPINVIRLGSKHTLHDVSGKVADNAIWYEPSFRPSDTYKPGDYRERTNIARRDIKRISNCKYGDKLANAIVSFVRALDEPDPNTCFIKLWVALESLLSPGQGTYDLIVRRCSFLFKHSGFHKQVLQSLKEYRNASVHKGEETTRVRNMCFNLQFYFIRVALFHITMHKRFDSLDEANQFLDLPPDQNDIMKRKQILDAAIKFRNN